MSTSRRGGKKSRAVQQLLGIARPDAGVSTWRGPTETQYVIRRREQRYQKQRVAMLADKRILTPGLPAALQEGEQTAHFYKDTRRAGELADA